LASEKKILIALEFLPWTPVDTIRKLGYREIRGSSQRGIVLDTFHYFMENQAQELYEVPIEKIFLFHWTMSKKSMPT